MGRTKTDEFDDLRLGLADDPELAATFEQIEASEGTVVQRRSGSEFANPLKGFVPLEPIDPEEPATERPITSRSGLPVLHDDALDRDTPTQRYIKAIHAPASGPLSGPYSDRESSPNGPPSSELSSMPVPLVAVKPAPKPPVKLPAKPPVKAPAKPPASSDTPDFTTTVTEGMGGGSGGIFDTAKSASRSGSGLVPLAEALESEGPVTTDESALLPAREAAAPAVERAEDKRSPRMWLLLGATVLSAIATAAVLMLVVRPLPQPSATQPSATVAATAPAPPPPEPPKKAPPPAPTPTLAATPEPPPSAVASVAPVPAPAISVAAPSPVIAGSAPFPQFVKVTPGAPLPPRPAPSSKPTAAPTAAPKAPTGDGPIFQFDK